MTQFICMEHLPVSNKKKFNKNLYNFYFKNKRFLMWREEINPYYILVSEFMLQQTQVSRVEPFFRSFIMSLPTIFDLAHAPLENVIILWNGLGYNRRCRYLWEAAQYIVKEYNGIIPSDPTILLKIKGIGEYTAHAIVTYSYNIPHTFIETNIRSVFLILYKRYFNQQKNKISDDQFKFLVNYYIDNDNPRNWYYAMMDFGSLLKKKYNNKHIQKSKTFTKQSTFKNSFRQLRGNIIKQLIECPTKSMTENDLKQILSHQKLELALQSLLEDKLICYDATHMAYRL